MTAAARLALAASGLFLMLGLVLGVWKYRKILASPEHRAPVYVDVAHRAALMYSFAALVMMALVEHSPYSASVQMWATATPIFFFTAAILSYAYHGLTEDTDNQFRERNFVTTWGMGFLILGELGGVGILVWGFLEARVF